MTLSSVLSIELHLPALLLVLLDTMWPVHFLESHFYVHRQNTCWYFTYNVVLMNIMFVHTEKVGNLKHAFNEKISNTIMLLKSNNLHATSTPISTFLWKFTH